MIKIKEIKENIEAFIEYAFAEKDEKKDLLDSLEHWIEHQKINKSLEHLD